MSDEVPTGSHPHPQLRARQVLCHCAILALKPVLTTWMLFRVPRFLQAGHNLLENRQT